MAQENEDDDIAQHLLEKVKYAIKHQDPQQNLVTKFFSFESEIESVMKTLERQSNPNVKDDWQSLRRENLYYLNNLLSDWQIAKNQSSFTPKQVYESCENIKRNLRKMKRELSGDQESSSRGARNKAASTHQEPYHPVFEVNKSDVFRWSSRHGPRRVHGLEHIVMAMERDLVWRDVNDPFKAFGIVGVAGIGKTTLCQAIFGRSLVKEHFSPRIWVCLSKQPRDEKDYRRDVVVRILKCLGVEDKIIDDAAKADAEDAKKTFIANASASNIDAPNVDASNIDEPNVDASNIIEPNVDASNVDAPNVDASNFNASNVDKHGLKRLILLLRLQLIGRRYFIVLDDAWNDDKFFSNLTTQKEKWDENWGKQLAYGFPKGCGGTIICSSKSNALLRQMLGKDVSLRHLETHTKEIIYEIFKDNVVGYDEHKIEFPRHLVELKTEILNTCDGIPLAAIYLAKIAREGLLQEKPKPTSTAGV